MQQVIVRLYLEDFILLLIAVFLFGMIFISLLRHHYGTD